jgi:hypothetical protein
MSRWVSDWMDGWRGGVWRLTAEETPTARATRSEVCRRVNRGLGRDLILGTKGTADGTLWLLAPEDDRILGLYRESQLDLFSGSQARQIQARARARNPEAHNYVEMRV